MTNQQKIIEEELHGDYLTPELENLSEKDFRESFKLTERGLFWLKIDTVNTFGLDKLTHPQQLEWFAENIEPMFSDEDNLDSLYEGMIEKAESPFEFRQCLENYIMYLDGRPVNGMMYVDCSNQALQVYALTTGDLKTAQVCNLAGEPERKDGYQMLADSLNKSFTEPLVTRSLAKKPMMTTLYGKQRAVEAIINDIAKDLESVDTTSPEFLDNMNEIFKESMIDIAPNAMKAMDVIQSLNSEDIGTYYWTLPDGFKVEYKVKVETEFQIDKVSKGGIRFHIEDKLTEFKPNKYNAGMAPNVIHSIDGYIIRELIRRADYHFMGIHDAYGQHYNDVDTTIANFKDICISILVSDLLNNIMEEIADGRPYQKIIKSNTLKPQHILDSIYDLS